MTDETNTHSSVLDWTRLSVILWLVCVGLLAVATTAGLVRTIALGESWVHAVGLAAALAAEAAIAAWSVASYGLVRVVVSNEDAVRETAQRLNRMESLLEDQGTSLNKLIELQSLSDQAKSLVFREAEVEAFRDTIHHDLIKQDYDSAEKHIDAIERKFGYTDEAAELRTEMEASRRRTQEEKVDAAVARIDSLCEQRNWARAFRESQRLMNLLPGNSKIADLPQRVTRARNAHKRALLSEYSDAVRKNDVDRGIELLKELDNYLTPQEAAALEESARGVFKEKLHTLGVQFAILVTDGRWADALATGEQITREFPNTRMAQEVREKIDLLRARAAEVSESGAAGKTQRCDANGFAKAPAASQKRPRP